MGEAGEASVVGSCCWSNCDWPVVVNLCSFNNSSVSCAQILNITSIIPP